MAKNVELSLDERMDQALTSDGDKPYDVPHNWVWTALSFVAKFSQGVQVPVDLQFDSIQNGRIRFIRIVDYTQQSNEIRYIDIPNKSRCGFVNKDDIVMVRYGASAGFVGRGIDGVIANNMFSIVPNANIVENNYLFIFLNSPEIYHYLNTSGGSSAMPAINFKLVSEIKFPLPPLSEQRRIVDIVESLFEKLDHAKDIVQNALDSFESRKSAILHKAFTGELTVKWREKNGLDFEKDWEEKRFGDIVKFSKNKVDPSVEEKVYIYIGLEHIEKNHGIIGKGSSDDVKSLKSYFKSGDILYGKLRPYLNKHDITDFEGICSTDILVIRCTNLIINKFLNYYINLPNFIHYVIENSKGINLPRVSEKEISNYILYVPTLEEQKEIVRILDDLLGSEQKSKELCDIIDKIDLMKKSILARAFRGELNTNNSEEESAIELLKQVL